MMNKPLWLVSYDIACTKRLRRVHKFCASKGWGLQKSVFVLAALPNERQAWSQKLAAMIDAEQDKLLWLPFMPNGQSFHLGKKDEWLIVHDDARLNGFVF